MLTGALLAVLVLISLQRLAELRLAGRNQARLLAGGAREFGAGHYPLFFVLHAGWLIGWLAEGLAQGPRLARGWPLWLALLILAQLLRWWSIRTLGHRWTTRIMMVKDAPRIRTGPYRFFSHPNYLAVGLELLAGPLVFGAWRTGVAATVLNLALLLLVRIPAEERALSGRL